MDEPTTGMDPKSKREAWDLIKEEKKHRFFYYFRCMILTTHDMEEADMLNDRIGIIKSGEIIALGSS